MSRAGTYAAGIQVEYITMNNAALLLHKLRHVVTHPPSLVS